KKAFIIAFTFGAFQALMPLIGYFFSYQLSDLIESIDHWLAFILLGVIGCKMIYESFNQEEIVCAISNNIDYRRLLLLAIATSIDALAVGISFAFLNVNIYLAIIIIGSITFILSFIGVKIGCTVGAKFKKPAELLGGIILILIGLKILVEHIGII
ncbi:manganese efflux pump MntP family protein, partial [Erysipelotrichaceae bacterium OttesenSCG-928-M19]|nr:manganese efflux pump MntP family protein [Erysipelotrichaceae bacterium OttesenSCG-928-M19]